jgi:FAD/FMN-containing dehydrogenase
MQAGGSSFRVKGAPKVTPDWAVPFRGLHDAIVAARAAAGRQKIAQPVIYGHAGNGHPHENFIARNPDELAAVERAVTETLGHVLEAGGTVAAEHGIGKLKRRWLPLQMSELQIRAMRSLKAELDPTGILAPDNVLP